MDAPGWPGIPPAWTSSAKDAVSTALGASRVWFTIGYGILNEVYWPRVDSPQIRDLGFIVADGAGFWSEVKRDCEYEISFLTTGVPAVTAVHTHPRYRLTVKYCPDPDRDVVLVDCQLDAPADHKLYVLLAPHLGNTGQHNSAWIAQRDDRVMLMARGDGAALSLCASDREQRPAIKRGNAGFVGVSDGWQDFARNGRMTTSYREAHDGNVALLAELDAHEATLALGFGDTPQLAATLAISSLQTSFEDVWLEQIRAWRQWQERLELPPAPTHELTHEARVSAMVLKVHEDRVAPGALVASLSIPWGQSRDDTGGYHLVWTRDLVEAAGGLLAIGSIDDVRRILAYLIATQQPDGHWNQNQWLDGRPFWKGIQLDEVGFPILLASALRQRDALAGMAAGPMVRRAAQYLAQNGPVTAQDRWEEDAGLNPFTLAVTIAALVCAAEFVEEPSRSYLLELADSWNSRIEDWTYVSGTELAREFGVDGYYIRIAPPDIADRPIGGKDVVHINNRSRTEAERPATSVISLDFLALVRLGLRRADDPRIRDTVRVADELLKVDTPAGPVWHRYTGDGYGEGEDGSPFSGVGVGRGWPLLTGEHGHYALAAGESTTPYLEAMRRMASPGGMLPEQVWDDDDRPAQHLYRGRPTGSAMPLAWAHAEYLKLLKSRQLGYSCDRPAPVWERYRGQRASVPSVAWRFSQPIGAMQRGKQLRIEALAHATIHWSTDGWRTVQDTSTRDTGLGIHVADLPTAEIGAGSCIRFTFYWPDQSRWEGHDFEVVVDQ